MGFAPSKNSPLGQLLAIVTILFGSGAFLSMRGSVDGSDVFSQMVWLSLYFLAAITLFASGNIPRTLRSVSVVLWLILGLVFLSVLWSTDPSTTLRRAVALAGTTLIGMSIGGCLERSRIVYLAATAWTIAAIASIIIVVANPGLGIAVDMRGADWRGVFSHKNTLGIAMAWGVIACYFAAKMGGRRFRPIWIICLLVCLIPLVMSGSRTSILLPVLSVLAALAIVRMLHFEPNLRAGVALIAVVITTVVIVVSIANFASLTEMLGRDPTLTGRTQIWANSWDAIKEKPFFGYGFEAFWGGLNSPAQEIWLKFGVGLGYTDFRVMSAHNAWLNAWLSVGLTGVILVAAFVVQVFRALFRMARIATETVFAPMAIAHMILLLGSSLLEGSMLSVHSITWLLPVAYLCAANIAATEQVGAEG